jgi:hypothetical protein
MGLGLVELTLCLERRFDISIEDEAWEAIAPGRRPFDVTAAEVSAMVKAQCALGGRVRHNEHGKPPVLDHQRAGRQLPTDDIDDVWPGVRDEIAVSLGVRPEQVRQDSWLVRDLGLSV